MAFTHDALVIEVRTTGDDDNGGGYVGGGSDFSQQDAAQATLTAASVVNSTTTIVDVDSGDYTCTDNDVGNFLQITGGTATAGFYEITARSAQQWTLDRAAGTVGQTVVGAMGGALASPGMAGSLIDDDASTLPGVKIHIGGGTYTISSSTANVSGGRLSAATGLHSIAIEGYNATRGDLDTVFSTTNYPILQASTSMGGNSIITLLNTGNAEGQACCNLIIDGNSQATTDGFNCVDRANLGYKILAKNCVEGFSSGTFAGCKAEGCTTGFTSIAVCYYCECDNCTTGFNNGVVSGASYINCLGRNGTVGFSALEAESLHVGCVAHQNSSHGFSSTVGCSYCDCLATNNTGTGFDIDDGEGKLVNCAGYSNSGGDYPAVNVPVLVNFQALSADPYESESTHDYRPNNTANGGADLRAAGCGLLDQTNNQDIGALQHEDPAGGGGGFTARTLFIGGGIAC